MNSKDIQNLSEAYLSIYDEEFKELRPSQVPRVRKRQNELVSDIVTNPDAKDNSKKERLANRAGDALIRTAARRLKKPKEPKNRIVSFQRQVAESYNIILSYLLDEGYADSYESAHAIMRSMSEEWSYEILDLTEAKRRLSFTTVYHGTSPESKRKIQKSGFKGDEVFASTDPEIASSFGGRYSSSPEVIRMRVPTTSISPEPKKGARAVKTQGQRGIDNWGREHYSIAMDPEYASKRISPARGILTRPRVPQKYRDVDPYGKIRPKGTVVMPKVPESYKSRIGR